MRRDTIRDVILFAVVVFITFEHSRIGRAIIAGEFLEQQIAMVRITCCAGSEATRPAPGRTIPGGSQP